jgi:hypothetical protein
MRLQHRSHAALVLGPLTLLFPGQGLESPVCGDYFALHVRGVGCGGAAK